MNRNLRTIDGCGAGPCPLCGCTDRAVVGFQRVPDLDYGGSAGDLPRRRVSYRACFRCGTVSRDPPPAQDTLDAYYGSIEMERHVPAVAAYKDVVYRDRLDLLREATGLRTGACLEVGCGNAVFLQMIRDEWGLDACGLEPSGTYDTLAGEAGVRILRCGLQDLDLQAAGLPGTYALVVCRHVLEHVSDPGLFLDHLAGLTAAGGWLYVEVPSSLLLSRREYAVSGQNIHAVHLHHFTGPGLAEALRLRGLAVVRLEDRDAGGYPSLCVLAAEGLDAGELFARQLDRQQGQDRAAAARLARILQDPAAGNAGEVLIWGAGADLVNVLDHLAPGPRSALRVYDRNPAKQGKTLAGAPILDPAGLAALRPRLILAGCSNRSLVEDIRAEAAGRFPGVPVAGLFEEN